MYRVIFAAVVSSLFWFILFFWTFWLSLFHCGDAGRIIGAWFCGDDLELLDVVGARDGQLQLVEVKR
jgi:hypothetical protein